MAERFLSIEDLRKLTQESTSVWRKRLARRELPFFRCGSNTRVSEADFQAWLEKRMVKSN